MFAADGRGVQLCAVDRSRKEHGSQFEAETSQRFDGYRYALPTRAFSVSAEKIQTPNCDNLRRANTGSPLFESFLVPRDRYRVKLIAPLKKYPRENISRLPMTAITVK